MTRRWPIALVLLHVGALGLRAENPHIEFVHALRKRGHPDLALEYLQTLQAKTIPNELATELPVEIGNARLDMAGRENERNRRIAHYQQAGADFSTFAGKYPTSSRAAEALVQQGRAAFQIGREWLNQANDCENPAARKPFLDRARLQFTAATGHFRVAITAAERHTQQIGAPDAELARLRLQAELEAGISMFHSYLTYDDVLAPARIEAGKQVLATLKKLVDRDKTNPASWVARAWLGRFHYEAQDFRLAKREVQAVIDERSPVADEGRCLARYVRLLLVDKESEVRDASAAKLKEAESWTKDYPTHLRTPEGLGIQFQRAEALVEQSRKRTGVESQRQLNQATAIYDTLEKANLEFAGQARERKLAIRFSRSADLAKGDISQLKDFQECWLRAQFEIYQRNQDAKNAAKMEKDTDPAEKMAQRRRNIVAALERALDLADGGTPAHERNEAQYTLAYLCLTELQNPYRAAVLGEDLARRDPTTARAGAAAVCTLQSYSQLISDAERTEGGTASETDILRLRRLALYMEKTWPADAVTDHARHQLGMLAIRANQFPEAIEILGQIAPTFPNFALSRQQLAFAARKAQHANVNAPPGKPAYLDQAISALRQIPELIPGADSQTLAAYIRAKRELAQLLFSSRRFEELAAVADQVTKAFDASAPILDPALTRELEPVVRVLPVYGRLGKADLQFRAGQHDEVVKLLQPVLQQLEQNALPDLNDPQTVRLIRTFGFWGYVHRGDRKNALELFRLMLKQGNDSGLESSSVVLNDLLAHLRYQMDELRKEEKAGTEQLTRAVKQVTEFLDVMSSDAATQRTPELIRFLAMSYSILEQHGRAADFLAQVPPAADAAKEPSQQAFQIMHARELRLARRFDETQSKLRDILKTDWGKKNIEAKKELLSFWEDKGDYSAAARGWNELMTTVRPLMDQNPRLQDLYYECYFHVVFCLCKGAEKVSDGVKKREELNKAASWYVKLKRLREDMGGADLPARYAALLQADPAFKKACEELSANSR